MIRNVSLATLTLFLCGALLSAAWSEPKVPKTPKTAEQIAKWAANHPAEAAARASAQAAGRPGGAPTVQPSRPPVGVSAEPYRRDGRPGGAVVPQALTYPQHGGGNDPGVIRRDDTPRRDGHYQYVGNPAESGRAYELPGRPGGNHNGPGGYGNHGGPGGHPGGHGGPPPCPAYAPPPVYVSQTVYVPQPVYVPEPVWVSGARFLLAPRPRCGGAPAYYPEYERPFASPYRHDINSMPLLGSEIIAADGAFLGVIDRDYDSRESIANRNSAFGDPYSPVSIWNPEGPYGSPTAPLSPWNRYSFRPPVLYWHGVFRGYLSTNPEMQPKVSPDSLTKHIWVSPWR